MKKFEFDELIEKAFSIGYEYALEEQKEFGNKENKRKKRAWESSLGKKILEKNELLDKNSTKDHIGRLRFLKKCREAIKNGGGLSNIPKDVKEFIDGVNDEDAFVNLGRLNNRDHSSDNTFVGKYSLNDVINQRSKKQANDDLDRYNKRILKDYKGIKNNDWYLGHSHLEDRINKIKELEEKEERLKNLKKAGIILGTGAAIAGTAYGIKRYRDKKKKEKEEQINK